MLRLLVFTFPVTSVKDSPDDILSAKIKLKKKEKKIGKHLYLSIKKKFTVLFLFFAVFSSVFCGGEAAKSQVVVPDDEYSEMEVPVYSDGVFVDSEGRLTITRFGIRWVFNKEYQYGQFANGDYWVIGPVTLVGIYPESREISGRTAHGSMLNPVVDPSKYAQGYDSSCDMGLQYRANLNAALNVSSSNPLDLANGSSLVSTISASAGSYPQLKTAAVLTVLSTEPATGSFRPPYCGTDKTVKFNKSQLNYTILKTLDPVADTPSLADVEKMFERVWLDHIPGYSCEDIRPSDNQELYGREISRQIGIGALMLHLNFSDKETLLVRYVQLGIDLYGVVKNGGRQNWTNDGGHGSGRKWPILFAGLVLGDADMQNIGQLSGDYLSSGTYGPGNVPPDYIHFGEDDQTFYVTQDDVDITNSAEWNPDKRNPNYKPYISGDIGKAEWGICHATDPELSDADWGSIYRQVTGTGWGAFVLAARIMNARTLWNHPALFDYMDRYIETANEQSDSFAKNMWDTYRASY